MYAINGKRKRVVLQKDSIIIEELNILGFTKNTAGFTGGKTLIRFEAMQSVELFPVGILGVGSLRIIQKDMYGKQLQYWVKFGKSVQDNFIDLKLYIDSVRNGDPMDFDSLNIPTLVSVEEKEVENKIKFQKIKRIALIILAVLFALYVWLLNSAYRNKG